MKSERYLVSIRRDDGAARKVIWEGEKTLTLDRPNSWKLERTPQGLRFRLNDRVEDFSESVSLPLGDSGSRLNVFLTKAPTLSPAYLSSPCPETSEPAEMPAELRISCGSRQSLASFQRLPRKYLGRCGKDRLFVLRKKRKGYELKARVSGISIALQDGSIVSLERKAARVLTESELEKALIVWKSSWWRLSRVVARPLVEMSMPAEPSEDELERLWLRKLNKRLALGCVVASLILIVMPRIKDSAPALEAPLPESTRVSLKKPKVIEKIVHRKPEAAPAPAPAAPAPRHEHPKRHVAKQPPKPVVPQVNEAALRAKQQAIAQKDLAKSLNFLSSAPAPKTAVITDRSDARYKTMAQVAPSSNTSSEALSRIAQASPSDGPIKTEGAREINTSVAVAGGHGKALNDVQGRVSMNALRSGNGSGAEALLSSKGMSVSGDGSLAESEIERALAKHLQRFQYCYEKALLTDSTLAGNVMMQWTIGSGGGASEISVVRSQLNSSQLHQCLASELAKVRFSAPQGGTVIVKYPFAFSSTPF